MSICTDTCTDACIETGKTNIRTVTKSTVQDANAPSVEDGDISPLTGYTKRFSYQTDYSFF